MLRSNGVSAITYNKGWALPRGYWRSRGPPKPHEDKKAEENPEKKDEKAKEGEESKEDKPKEEKKEKPKKIEKNPDLPSDDKKVDDIKKKVCDSTKCKNNGRIEWI